MQNYLMLFYAFVLGAIFASFSSAIAWRTGPHKHKSNIKDKKYSVIYGRSMCPNCEKTLPWWALVPILSYIYLKGKCFNCKKEISIFYPLMEVVCGIYTLLITNSFFNNNINFYTLIIYLFVFFVLIILSFQDIWFGEISDKIAIPAIVIVLISQLIYSIYQNSFDYFSSFLFLSIIVLIIFGALIAFTGAMGGGDLRIFVLVALVLSPLNLLFALTIAFTVASIFGGFTAYIKKKVDFMKYHVRLIPYLTIGFALLTVWSNIMLLFLYK